MKKLNLNEVAGGKVDLNERPLEHERAPLTPPSQIVAELRAKAMANALSEPGRHTKHFSRLSPRTLSSFSGSGGFGSGSATARAAAAAAAAAAAVAPPAAAAAPSDAASVLPSALRTGTSWTVDVGEIRFGQRLGAGAYGEVYAAKWRRSKVAVKRLLCSSLDDTAVAQFVAEMEILANARHDHIVRFLGGCVERDKMCILFEFCPQSLFDLLRTAPTPLKTERLLGLARGVALGIYYLHCCKPPVLHLDLKSANVLLDQHGRAKVCDFGLAHLKLHTSGILTARTGSPMWTAPEVLKGEAITEAADTFSYGMLLFELLTRQLPHASVPAPQLVVGVITGMLAQPAYDEKVAGREYPEALPALMRSCWHYEAARRPNFETVLDRLDEIASQLEIDVNS